MDDRDSLDRLFAKLAVGANVTTPVGEQWPGYYGKLTDRFGVQWMMNVPRVA